MNFNTFHRNIFCTFVYINIASKNLTNLSLNTLFCILHILHIKAEITFVGNNCSVTISSVINIQLHIYSVQFRF